MSATKAKARVRKARKPKARRVVGAVAFPSAANGGKVQKAKARKVVVAKANMEERKAGERKVVENLAKGLVEFAMNKDIGAMSAQPW